MIPKRIIQQLKRKFYQSYYVFSNFKMFNKKFLLRIDCKSAKEILQKDVQNIVSKQISARWQAILSAFDFDIEFIQGQNNSLPDFLTREFLQGAHHQLLK